MAVPGYLKDICAADGKFCASCLEGIEVKGFPAAPHGPSDGQPIDVLLVGWNPRLADYERNPDDTVRVPMTQSDWLQDAHKNVDSGLAFFRKFFGELPRPLRVVNTRMWRWPSNRKADYSVRLGRACAEVHLWNETSALQPSLVVTYDTDASAFYQRRAPVPVEPFEPMPVTRGKRPDRLYWTAPFDDWGWRCALVLGGRPQDRENSTWPLIGKKIWELAPQVLRE